MIYGIDASKRRAAVACPATGFTAVLRLPDKMPHELALGELRRWAERTIPSEAAVVIERPLNMRNGQESLNIAMSAGAVVAGLLTKDIRQVAVNEWKKEICGLGGLDKPECADWLATNDHSAYTACHTEAGRLDSDLVDAFCIAHWGHLGR